MNTTIRAKDKAFQAIVSYKQNGKWKQKSKQGFKTKADAKKWSKEVEFSIMEDIKDNIDPVEMTLEQALEIYLEYKKNTVKPTSYKNYEALQNTLTPLKNKHINKIKPINITSFFAQLQQNGKYSYLYAQKQTRAFFNFCIKELKIIRENPVNIIKKAKKDHRIKYISKQLYKQILDYTPNPNMKLLIKILYHTGMRISEAKGLKITDIKESVITIQRQIQRGKITTLKSQNSYRQIPIPEQLYSEIKAQKIISLDGFLFPPSIHPYRILKKFNTSAHCFRHTYATNLVAQGVNLKVASEILGDEFETFINTYVQSSKEETQKVFKKIIGA